MFRSIHAICALAVIATGLIGLPALGADKKDNKPGKEEKPAGGAAATGEAAFDPSALFQKPVPLKDASGKDLVTGKAMACPFVYDWTGDGVNDLVIGSKVSMDTATGSIYLVKNVGSNADAKFDWANAYQVQLKRGELAAGSFPVQANCG